MQVIEIEFLRRKFNVAIFVRPDVDTFSRNDCKKVLSDVEFCFVNEKRAFFVV